MRLFAVTAFTAALLATPVLAADTYVIDPSHTQVQFSVDRFGFNQTLGVFTAVAGEFNLDTAAPEHSTVHAAIQIASLDSNNPAREKAVLSPAWLDAAKYPEMTFVSTAVKVTSAKTAEVTGDLTLHGVTRPVTLMVQLNKIGTYPVTNATAAGFSATAMIKRSDFGIKIVPQFIGDDVTIRIEVLGVPPKP